MRTLLRCNIFRISRLGLFLFISGALLIQSCSPAPRFTRSKIDSEKPDAKERTEKFNGSKVLLREYGIASYYAHEYHGKTTSNGEKFNMFALTAAHKSYPFETIVKVTNLSNKKNVTIRINDRMPDYNPRIIDLSLKAAEEIDMIQAGISEVMLEILRWGN